MGYARVSTVDQTLALQQDALRHAGCDRLFTDVLSGSTTERPGLADALDHLRAGNVSVVWKLDWLGRSLSHLRAAGAEQIPLHGDGAVRTRMHALREALGVLSPHRHCWDRAVVRVRNAMTCSPALSALRVRIVKNGFGARGPTDRPNRFCHARQLSRSVLKTMPRLTWRALWKRMPSQSLRRVRRGQVRNPMRTAWERATTNQPVDGRGHPPLVAILAVRVRDVRTPTDLSAGMVQLVDTQRGTCTCPAVRFRHGPCKPLLAARTALHSEASGHR